VDSSDPAYADLVSSTGVELISPLAGRIQVGEGAGGRAIAENRLVVMNDYANDVHALESFAKDSLRAAMAAPVHEDGEVVGSLVVASHSQGRRYSATEQELLLSFADHASLALTNAKNAESLRRALEDARHDAMHDVLTTLPNRALLRDRLDQASHRAVRHGSQIALLFLDLDGFKDINDSLGHDAGDELLVAVAHRLDDCLRDADTIARLGGDEFAVVVEDVADIRDVQEIADRLLSALAQPVSIHGRDVAISASIGIAVSGAERPDPRALLQNADLAMYEAKRSGGACSVRFEGAMQEHVLDRLDIEHDLRQAIAKEQLAVHYQPIWDLQTGAAVGAEALVRWQHPVRGAISPAEFIPIAESSRLIATLGEWVLRQACAQATQWPQNVTVSVNLSPRQMEPELPRLVAAVLQDTGLAPQRLTLEVTEGMAMTDSPQTMDVIQQLHRMGVHLAIDDFGTGYSSLGRLRDLPVDQIKIDRTFVADLDTRADGAIVISAIVALCAGAGLIAVAEGVETYDQLRQLQALGCDRAQGFLLARPAPADLAAELLVGDVSSFLEQREHSA
jgi:diguanylate cyclase (GGDEF)-like protein